MVIPFMASLGMVVFAQQFWLFLGQINEMDELLWPTFFCCWIVAVVMWKAMDLSDDNA